MAETPKTNFADLMQAGRVAFAAGKPQMAHDLWREAARVDPYNEQVWLALLDVLDTDQDRKVCLQNILVINPMNVQARRQLSQLENRLQRLSEHEESQLVRVQRTQSTNRALLRKALLLGIAIGLSGVFFAIVISILLYGH
jgi:ferric-dicitrate binding protein FerR (iron transport regulator)